MVFETEVYNTVYEPIYSQKVNLEIILTSKDLKLEHGKYPLMSNHSSIQLHSVGRLLNRDEERVSSTCCLKGARRPVVSFHTFNFTN